MNEIPKVVFSRTLQTASWGPSSIARDDLTDEISALQRQTGGEIIAWGGAKFAQSLIRADLINEFAIVTRPVAYGSGKPLFSDLVEALRFDVLASTTYDDGTALNLFKPR